MTTDEQWLANPVFCAAVINAGVGEEMAALADEFAPVPELRQVIHDRALEILGDPVALIARREVLVSILSAISQAVAEVRDDAERALLEVPAGTA